MIKRKRVLQTAFVFGLGIILVMQAATAHAWQRSRKSYRHYTHYRHHPHHPHDSYIRTFIFLPFGSITLRVGSDIYYYHDGRYYRRLRDGYVVVRAPRGACLSRLPFGAKTIYVQGKKYYLHDGVYYHHTPAGYVVIDDPNSIVIVQKSQQDKQVLTRVQKRWFSVNVPNKYGGYTEVVILRKGEGFVGPQGEYYREFPDLEQLRVMYGS